MPVTILPSLLLQIFDWIVRTALHIKEKTVLLLNFRGLSTNIRLPKKMKFAIGILTCHVNGQGYVQKHFFGCVA